MNQELTDEQKKYYESQRRTERARFLRREAESAARYVVEGLSELQREHELTREELSSVVEMTRAMIFVF